VATTYFLDTSAVVKRYVQETGTAWVKRLADPAAGHFLYVARIADVEMTAAIARRRRSGSLTLALGSAAINEFRHDFAQHYRIVEITIPLLGHASQLADLHVLRAYDAVQLAAALDIHQLDPSLRLVSADADLNAAARAEGLPVEDPNLNP
jgi:predicted nucleic acid-binding protein